MLNLKINGMCEGMNITHLSLLMVPYYHVKIETPKMHVNTSSPFNASVRKTSTYFLCNFVENQGIFVLFSLLDSLIIGTCTDMNFIHRT